MFFLICCKDEKSEQDSDEEEGGEEEGNEGLFAAGNAFRRIVTEPPAPKAGPHPKQEPKKNKSHVLKIKNLFPQHFQQKNKMTSSEDFVIQIA